MNLSETFKRLGMGRNCAAIYKALLESKTPVLVANISRKTGISRPEVYRNLSALSGKKFIRKTSVGKRSGYLAENPRRLMDEFRVLEHDAETVTEKLSKRKEKDFPSNMVYLKGPGGIRAAFDDAIQRTKKGGMFYRYTSERDLASVNKYLSPHYRTDRDSKKLERRVISNPISGKAKRSRLERFIKFIRPEADMFEQNIIQLIYEDSVAFINLNTEEVSIIRDRDLARFQVVIFNQLYKKL